MKDQFYITLPSNSSMKYFNDNRTTRFTTQLPRRIELVGEWEAALVEIQYPQSFETITRQHGVVRLHKHHSKTPAENFSDIPAVLGTGEGEISSEAYVIEPGVYTDAREIARALNAVEGLKRHVKFGRVDGDEARMTVTRICTCDTGHYLSFSPRLYRCLGFDKMTDNIRDKLEADHPVDTTAVIPTHMFVYGDIVEPRMVGDVYAPLLRIIQTVGKNFRRGGTEIRILSSAHYVPLLLTNFHTIEIDIRDSQGKSIPFTGGTLTVTLHFKRVN